MKKQRSTQAKNSFDLSGIFGGHGPRGWPQEAKLSFWYVRLLGLGVFNDRLEEGKTPIEPSGFQHRDTAEKCFDPEGRDENHAGTTQQGDASRRDSVMKKEWI